MKRPSAFEESKGRRSTDSAPVDDSTAPVATSGTPDQTDAAASENREAEAWFDDAPITPRAVRAAARRRKRVERGEIRRFTRHHRRRRIIQFGVLGTVVALAVAAVGVAYSPLMALRDVRVEGASMIPADEIVTALDGQLGTPLPLIDGATVQSALAGFRLIETYSIEAIPPSTLVVRVVERTPVGVVEADAGFDLVDGAGVVLSHLDEAPAGQPVITAEGGVAGPGFQAASGVIRSLPDEVRAQLVGVSAATADDVRLDLSGGASVVWGSADESSLKGDVLRALMIAAPSDGVDEYDVSSPNSPVTS